MLNESAISEALENCVAHLERDNLDQAEATLRVLDFDRLLKPIEDPSKQRQRRFVDPAEGYGVERVHETGDHIHACFSAILNARSKAA